jgi:hypothetical protein
MKQELKDSQDKLKNALGPSGMLSQLELRLQVKLLHLWPLKKCGLCLNDTNVFAIQEWVMHSCRIIC